MVQEIEIHRSLGHRHVVGFHGYFEDKNNIYILLELCRRRVSGLNNITCVLYMYMFVLHVLVGQVIQCECIIVHMYKIYMRVFH